MDKGRRNELTKLKFKKRLKTLGLKQETPKDYTCYKHQAKPCSCFVCSRKNHGEKAKYKHKFKLSKAQIEEERLKQPDYLL